jgi:hypothetical protein
MDTLFNIIMSDAWWTVPPEERKPVVGYIYAEWPWNNQSLAFTVNPFVAHIPMQVGAFRVFGELQQVRDLMTMVGSLHYVMSFYTAAWRDKHQITSPLNMTLYLTNTSNSRGVPVRFDIPVSEFYRVIDWLMEAELMPTINGDIGHIRLPRKVFHEFYDTFIKFAHTNILGLKI